MRRSVVGSIGSTDTVTGGNTDRNVRQTILGSAVLATRQSDSKYPSDGEVELGRLVLIIAVVQATGLDVTSLDCPETKPAPSSSAVNL